MYAEFSTERTIKATRKTHRCEWCYEAIDIGSPAFYGSNKYDGEFNDFYMHPECRDAMNKEISDSGDGWAEFGERRKRGQVELYEYGVTDHNGEPVSGDPQ